MLNLIKRNNEPAPYTDKHEVVSVLQKAVALGGNINHQDKHIENIHDLVGKHRIFDPPPKRVMFSSDKKVECKEFYIFGNEAKSN